MKYILLFASLLFMGCSSAEKAAAPAKDAPKAEEAKKDAPKKAAAPKAASGDVVTCTYGEIKREIILVQRDGGCAVEYARDGATSEIATGSATSTFCKEVQE